VCSSLAVAKSTVNIDKIISAFDLSTCYLSQAIAQLACSKRFLFFLFLSISLSLSLSLFLSLSLSISLTTALRIKCRPLYSGARTLTFVQKRPIGLGIKNNLGSLRRRLLALIFIFFSLSSATFFLFTRRSFDELSSREVSLEIFNSRASCFWRSLSY